jgi:hypothetical protein
MKLQVNIIRKEGIGIQEVLEINELDPKKREAFITQYLSIIGQVGYIQRIPGDKFGIDFVPINNISKIEVNEI